MKNVLIVGASGNMARHVIDRLVKKDDVLLTLFLRNARWLSLAGVLIGLFGGHSAAQTQMPLVRLAKIEVHPAQLKAYRAALTEEIEASVRLEPGVRTLYAVAEKGRPTHFTILEIYADSAAYRTHLQTPHFLKYKTGTSDMVKSLELVEVDPLVPGMKIK